ncbi:MAG: hypothetical protein IPI04_05645 [Ignavibacteria bacterium]|nr:hypothetical protein [Ignavibacteria bacterium]
MLIVGLVFYISNRDVLDSSESEANSVSSLYFQGLGSLKKSFGARFIFGTIVSSAGFDESLTAC